MKILRFQTQPQVLDIVFFYFSRRISTEESELWALTVKHPVGIVCVKAPKSIKRVVATVVSRESVFRSNSGVLFGDRTDGTTELAFMSILK